MTFLEAYSNATRIALNISRAPLGNESCSQAKICLIPQAESFDQLTMDSLMMKVFSNAVTTKDVLDTTTLCS